MARLRAALLGVLLLIGALAGGLVAIGASQAQEDQGVLARLLSNLLTTPTQQIQIGAVEGALSSRATILDVRISDEEGVWLTLDRAVIDWSRTTLLLERRLQVDELEIGALTVLRRPGRDAPAGEVEEGPIFPELPLEVRVDRFALERLELGEPVLGEAAALSAEGSVRIGDPQEGLVLDFAARRLDAPGAFEADVAYAPVERRLTLDVTLDEPAGGLVARLLDIPGLPPVTLALQGEGPLSAFAATLDFRAGEAIGAEGQLTANRVAGAYALDLDLAARIAGLLPPTVAPVFEGVTQLAGAATIGDDGRVGLDRLRLASAVAALSVTGAIGPEGALDLAVTGAALPTEAGATRAGAARIERLSLDILAQGTIAAPRLSGDVVAGGVSLPQGSLESLTLALRSAPIGEAEPPERFSIAIDAEIDGLALADPGLADAIGPEASVSATGEASLEGVVDVAQARIATRTFEGTFAGTIGPAALNGALAADAPDLSAFATLVGAPLAGSARVEARLVGDPSAERITAQLDGTLSAFASGTPALDGLLGGAARLTGTAQRIPGGFALIRLSLAGDNLTLVADGAATQEDADLSLDLAIPALAPLDPRIEAGSARAQARLSGSLARPDVAASAQVEGLVALGRPVERLTLELDGRDLTGALDARASLAGIVAGAPAEGTARLLRTPEGGLRLEGLDLDVAGNRAVGDLALGDSGLAAGRLRVEAGDLAALSPLLLVELAGALTADVELTVAEGGQDARIAAAGEALRFGDVALESVAADLAATDLWRAPILDGTLAARSLVLGGQTFEAVDLAFDGGPQGSAFSATSTAAGFALAAQGRVAPQDGGISVALDAFSAERDGRRVALDGPASLLVDGRAITIADLVLAADGGRVAVAGAIGDTLDLSAQIRALPLSVAEIALPGLGIEGVADGALALTGSPAAPEGDFALALAGFSIPALREAGLPPLDADLSGRFAGEAAVVEAAVSVGSGRVVARGTAPLAADGPLDLDLVLDALPLALADAVAPELGLRGVANGTAALGGRLNAPEGTFDVALADLSVAALREAGLAPLSAQAQGRFAGEAAVVEASLAVGDGRLAATGTIPFDPRGPLDLDLVLDALPLALADAAAPELGLRGVANGTAALGGRLNAPEGTFDLALADLSVAALREAGLAPLSAQAQGRFTGEAAVIEASLAANGGRVTATGTIPFDPAGPLDVAVAVVDLPLALARPFAPGLDLSGTASGEARLGGTPNEPEGPYELALRNVVLAPAARAGVGALNATATGRLQGNRATIDAAIEAQPVGALRATGSVPLDASGALDLSIAGPLALEPLSGLLPPGQSLGGTARIDLRAAGPLAAPEISGAARLENGVFRDDLRGIALAGVTAELAAQGRRLTIVTARGTTGNGGLVTATGSIGLEAGLPADLAIVARNAQLVETAGLVARADLDLAVGGALAAAPTISGDVRLLELDIAIPERLPTALAPLPGTRHVAPPPQVAARLAVARERETRAGAPFEATLDLTIVALNQIFVRGRGVNAELGGSLRLTGTSRDPVAIGGFELRRGRLDLLGQRIDFTRGSITFGGDLTPEIDLVAQTTAGDVTAIVAVTGPANAPTFEISSNPDLPQDEVLSRILFGRAAGGLSAAQALQLAQGLASLAGGGAGAFENLRRALGVDSLDIGVGETGPTVGVSRYISDNVRLGVRAGARPEESGVTVDIDLSRRLRLQGAVGADGRTSVGVGYEIEY